MFTCAYLSLTVLCLRLVFTYALIAVFTQLVHFGFLCLPLRRVFVVTCVYQGKFLITVSGCLTLSKVPVDEVHSASNGH